MVSRLWRGWSRRRKTVGNAARDPGCERHRVSPGGRVCQAGYGQVLYGSLTGIVTDPSGAVIPGAKVDVLNVGTGATREASTGERGTFLFNNLEVGTYKITVEAASFQTMALDNVQVNTNEVGRADFSLQIANDAVTVAGDVKIASQVPRG